MRYVVFGATGNVGSAVADLLAATEHDLTVVARQPDRLGQAIRARARVVVGSHLDPQVARDAARGADAVFWMSPMALTPEPRRFVEQTALAAASAAEVSDRFVTLSGAYCERRNVGLASLSRIVEQAVDRANPLTVHIRAGLFMSNLLMQLPALRAGVVSFPMPADAATGWIAPADIAAEAVSQMLTFADRRPRSIALVGPDRLSGREIADLLARLSNRPFHYIEHGEDTTQSMVQAGMPEPFVREMITMYNAFGRYFLAGDSPDGERRVGTTSFRTYLTRQVIPLLAT